jgi:signal transduction histidine kinase
VIQERRRLARDLHDSVTQSLHSLVLAGETSSHRLALGRLDRLEDSLKQMTAAARQALKDMRLLLYELRLVPLEDIRLKEALETRLDSVERRAGARAELEIRDDLAWPSFWQGKVYPIVLEALNNSLKHSQADQLRIMVNENRQGVEVIVQDNGLGFNLAQVNSGGMGLKNMHERAEQLGGSVEIQSGIGAGTTIRILLPRQAVA